MATYILDPAHSTIGFWVRHAMVTKVRGNFTEFEASLDPEAYTAQATIKTASINTGNADRDAHVRGTDFFAVEEFPEMTFSATSYDKEASVVKGNLTIKGVTKEIELEVEVLGESEDPFGNQRLGFEARTVINRRDFGVDFNAPIKTGGLLISEDVHIEIEGSAIKQ